MRAIEPDGRAASGTEVGEPGVILEGFASRDAVAGHVHGGRDTIGSRVLESVHGHDVDVAVDKARYQELTSGIDYGCDVTIILHDRPVVSTMTVRGGVKHDPSNTRTFVTAVLLRASGVVRRMSADGSTFRATRWPGQERTRGAKRQERKNGRKHA